MIAALASFAAGCSEGTNEVAGPEGGAACVADVRTCLDAANFRVCRPDGSGFDFGTCPQDQPCANGLCSNGDPNPDPNPGPNPDPGNNGDPTMGPCEPFERECVRDNLVRICRGDGSSYDLGICPEQAPCRGGYCSDDVGTPGTCTANVRECFDGRTVRICRPDGSAFDFYTCPRQQVCDAAACRDLGDCVDEDGDGYGQGDGCLAADCDDMSFAISPEGSEQCGDGVDEDCDGIDAPCTCDPVRQDCPGLRLMCSLGRNDSFECRSEGVLGEGELCGGIPSNCQRGLECIITGEDDRSRCTRICNPQSGQGCIGEAICGATLTGFDNVGLCVGATRCDPVDSPASCPQGTTCQPISNRDALCFEGGGTLTENTPCNPNDDQCASGTLCISIQGGNNPGNRCKALCKTNRGNADCTRRQGDACTPIELSFTLNGRTEAINGFGICD